MSINLNTKNYETAKEYLAVAAEPLNDISLDIATAIQNLDSRILPYIIEDYNYVNNQLKNVYDSNGILSNELENYKKKCQEIEKKATGATSYNSNTQLASLSAATSSSLTSQLLKVEEEAVIQNHIDNQEIAYLTNAYVSDPTSTLSYETTYVDEITAAADADIAATATKTAEKTETFWGKVGNFFKGIGNYIVDSIFHPFKTLVKTAASITNFAIGLINGVLNFVEALVDCVALIVSAAASLITGLIDLCQWIGGKISGNENWESVTKKMWNGTMKFVATKWVDKAFNSFYENTLIGQALDELSYEPFKHTGGMYSFSKGVGYVAGVVILTIVTYGAGGVAAGAGGAAGSAGSAAAGSATSSLASAASAVFTTKAGAAVLGAVGAAAGTGKNTQNAWADGASLGEGLTYGVAMGAYEGLQFYGGARINALKVPGVSGVKGQVINSGLHVALDTADGASSGFIDPLLKMIYTPNEKNMEQIMYYVNYDENGNQIDNKTWDELTFGQKYKAMFEYNGGWKTVGTNAALAGALSTLTEVPDIAAAIKTPKVDIGTAGKEAVENGLKTPEVDTSAAKQVTDGTEAAAKETGATLGTRLKETFGKGKKAVTDATGAAVGKGKSALNSAKEWFMGTRVGKKLDEGITWVKTKLGKTSADAATSSKSTLEEAAQTSSARTLLTTKTKPVKEYLSALKEKVTSKLQGSKTVAKVSETIDGVKGSKVGKTVTETVESVKDSAAGKTVKGWIEKLKETRAKNAAKTKTPLSETKIGKKIAEKWTGSKVGQAVSGLKETVAEAPVVKKGQKVIENLRGSEAASKARTFKAAMSAPGAQKYKLRKNLTELRELYKVDKSTLSAADLEKHLAREVEIKANISNLKLTHDQLEYLFPIEEQLDLDTIILTDKMRAVLKTDARYMTNDELMKMVDQASLSDFIKYVESQPNLSKDTYAKMYKRFAAALGLTTAGYFVLTSDYKK